MPVSVHGGLSGAVVAGLVSPTIVCRTLPAFSLQLGLWVCWRTRWVAVVCREFVSVVLSDFSIAILHSWIARVFIEGRFASARMASTGVVRSWPVMTVPCSAVISLDSPTLKSISTAATKMRRIPPLAALLPK